MGRRPGAKRLAAAPSGAALERHLLITAPNMVVRRYTIVGDGSPIYIHNFSMKAQNIIAERQEAGETAKKDRKRSPRDFAADFEGARHRLPDGSDGIPASGIRNALISACKVAGYAMTRAKLAVFVVADGPDVISQQPLIQLLSPDDPVESRMMAWNANGGADIRVRPVWTRWAAHVVIKFDADQFTDDDVTHLLMRAGMQVGLCDGRPDSKNSAGIGAGTFRLLGPNETLESVWNGARQRGASVAGGRKGETARRSSLRVVATKKAARKAVVSKVVKKVVGKRKAA